MSRQCPCCKSDGNRCKCKTNSETCHHHTGCPYGRTPNCIDEDDSLLYAPVVSPRASPDIDKLEEFQLEGSEDNDLALAVQMSLQRESKTRSSILSPRKKRCKGKNKDGSRCKKKSDFEYCNLHRDQEIQSLLQELYISYLAAGMDPNEAGAEALKECSEEIQEEYTRYLQKAWDDAPGDREKQLHPDYVLELAMELSNYGIDTKKQLKENKEQVISLIGTRFSGHDPEEVIKEISKHLT